MKIEEYLIKIYEFFRVGNPNITYEEFKANELKKMNLDINNLEAVKDAEECLNLYIKSCNMATLKVIFERSQTKI